MNNTFSSNDYKSKKFIKKFNDMWVEKCVGYDKIDNNLPPVNRIIVIGDIHGDIEILLECLIKAKLIEDKKILDYSIDWDNVITWTGGDTVVVQVGDQIDSCRYDGKHSCSDPSFYGSDMANDINILYFMTNLHKKARAYGGAIYSLIGNHELMNVIGDMSYVSHSNIISHSKNKNIEEGMKNRIDSFRPGNKMANFLACTRKIVLKIGDNLFVHAGIVPYITKKYNIDDINRILTLFLLDEFKDLDDIIKNDIFMSSEHSPLWTRIFGSKNIDKKCDELMNPLEQIYKVGKIFVGHTPQLKTGIISKCKDRVWLTDAGMPSAFNKFDHISIKTKGKERDKPRSAQVLEIKESVITVLR